MRRVLLHTCCAPCSGAIVEWMLANSWQPTIYYCNPNIFPFEEYLKRRDECIRYAQSLGIELVEDPYNHELWKIAVKGLEKEPERGFRCLECFKLRLLRSARYAAEHGFDILTTTLMSSRWKSLEQINEAGRWAVSQVDGVEWWDRNWRKGGLQQRRQEIIKEQNFYNQTYCGCEFSLGL